jgi:arabinogalactan oligomer / maltooligosaccharide transport system substrate-binding protein
MKKQTLLLAALATIASLLLSACNATSSTTTGKVSLTFWYTESSSEAPAILKIVNAFNKSHTNIQVNAQYVDFGAEHDKFAAAARAGKGAPDILGTDVSWTAEFAKDGYLLELEGHVDGGTSDFLPASLAYNMYNAHLWGQPETTSFIALYYNKALFQAANNATPPVTLDDLRTDALLLTNASKNQVGFAFQGSAYFLTPWLFADGGGLVSDDGKTILINNAGSIAGFQALLDMIHDNSLAPIDLQNGYTNALDGFKSGAVAMIAGTSDDGASILSGSAFHDPSNLGVVAFPIGTAGDVPRSPARGQNYSIYAGTQHPNEAIAFLNYLNSSASEIAIAQANGTLPARTSAYTAAVLQNPVIQAFHPLLGTAVSLPVNPKADQLFTAFDADIQNALIGTQSAQDALNKVAQDWAPLFANS